MRARRRVTPRRRTQANWLRYAAAALAGAVVVFGWTHWLGNRSKTTGVGSPKLDPRTAPPDAYAWRELPAPAFPLPPYARHLEGVRLVLDPGHGGRGDRKRWKRGPTGLREEVVNLRVAQYLREFLVAVGADVVLTRDADVFLDEDETRDLAKRIALANECQADLFLSIHHNGDASPEPNFTTVFYHGSPDHSPASVCAARHLLTGLDDALRLEQHLPCAVLSDQVLFQEGLAVLRLAEVPAVLVESSFHSNPQEEQRLRNRLYNRREAYGLFLGLARWARAGLPRVALVAPRDGVAARGGEVVVALDDGLSGRGGWGETTVKILRDSLCVRIDGKRVAPQADLATGRLTVKVPKSLAPGVHRMWVDFETVFGQHVLHPELEIRARNGLR